MSFRSAFPDLSFWGMADLIAEGRLCGQVTWRRHGTGLASAGCKAARPGRLRSRVPAGRF
jgi:hypothetical protein